jgi:RND family efflux transporter MFP subunit
MSLRGVLRIVPTLALVALAALLALALWHHYMDSPWTRDGRVRANIISIAPDVSGIVVEVAVRDNQTVHKGDLLFRIDEARYKLALARARASLSDAQAQLALRRREARRRAQLAAQVVSRENRDTAATQADAAGARYDAAVTARDLAQLNLDRTRVVAPTDGYVTNLEVHPGDYAVAGHPQLALVDSHSFWVYGYFEETKLPLIALGDAVDIRLLSGAHLRGHVESFTRGIADRENGTGSRLLASVNPTFSWVRLAQRIPVRIHIDDVPANVLLAAGMTCTVVVHPAGTDVRR